MRSHPSSLVDLARQVRASGLEDLLALTHTCVALLDPRGGIEMSNPAFAAMDPCGPGATDLGGLVVSDEAESAATRLAAASAGRSSGPFQMHLRFGPNTVACDCLLVCLESGDLLFLAEPIQASEASRGDRVHLLAQLEDLRTELAKKNVELEAIIAQADEVAHTDALTFLPNRRLILAELQREVTHAQRYRSPLTISMLDLDNFKIVNDNFGHTAGDQVLRTVARELRAHIRQPDMIGRYGGDEFLVILPHSDTTAAAEQGARLCRQIASLELAVRQSPVHLSLSVGIAQLQADAESWQGLLERADLALYQAKDAGGGRCKISEA